MSLSLSDVLSGCGCSSGSTEIGLFGCCFSSGQNRERIEWSESSLYRSLSRSLNLSLIDVLGDCGCSSGGSGGGLSSFCCDICRNEERVEHEQSDSKRMRKKFYTLPELTHRDGLLVA